MKMSRLLLLFILFSVLLIGLCLGVYAKPLHLKRLEAIRISKIQKVCMKEYARKRDYHVPIRSVEKAQLKINHLLVVKPMIFDFDRDKLFAENNQTNETNLSSNKVALARVIDVLNNIREDVAVNIEVHTDESGSNQHNLKVSQNCADRLKEYVTKRSHIVLVTSVGYGEEFPRISSDENLSNKRIEIHLKKVQK